MQAENKKLAEPLKKAKEELHRLKVYQCHHHHDRHHHHHQHDRHHHRRHHRLIVSSIPFYIQVMSALVIYSGVGLKSFHGI